MFCSLWGHKELDTNEWLNWTTYIYIYGEDIRGVNSIPGLENLLENGMATYTSIRAWRIPWTEEPGELQPMGSWRVRHDSMTKQQQNLLYSLQYKNQKVKIAVRNLIWNHLKQVRQINLCHNKRARVPSSTCYLGTQSLLSVRREEKKSFWNSMTWVLQATWYLNLLVEP